MNDKIIIKGAKEHNLKNINLEIPRDKLVVVTGLSGSGKSSLAFDTLYAEGQRRYVESLSSYARQFLGLMEKPDVESIEGLSPAIAIEQNKKWWNSRSTVWTLTEIDDYMRLLFAKLWDSYCYKCGKQIKPTSVDQIMDELKKNYLEKKIFLLKDVWEIKEYDALSKFVKKNRTKVEKWWWFTRYLLLWQWKEPVEYFYLEDPNVPKDYFPLKVYGIYDRVTVEKSKLDRLKEDIIKILSETEKFGIFVDANDNDKLDSSELNSSDVLRFTDKMYCPDCNVTYPEFSAQYFSPNRAEWACPECHGIWEVLQVDLEKVIDPYSPYMQAILPWRDSTFGQIVLHKMAEKYSIDMDKLWKDLPEWFQHVVV